VFVTARVMFVRDERRRAASSPHGVTRAIPLWLLVVFLPPFATANVIQRFGARRIARARFAQQNRGSLESPGVAQGLL
jgi:hypothetical protein